MKSIIIISLIIISSIVCGYNQAFKDGREGINRTKLEIHTQWTQCTVQIV